ncbi:plasmid pRiA4b ORF-3 family protein [Methylobacterium sp. J-059]|uniref:plasmid pRiA4b ORF-3 family protein n=1 Tax=Methylobacterium sp. J-059 TaxID=2836643 RepID=UPI001FBB89D9|nr:plasmid pRiA4b ORF-3 family protein [Methylobacterium sp. J-059]MCJ2041968.1 plasmid pRiA4b ORF-3 family protein [Methylobacterium sp. J-059]
MPEPSRIARLRITLDDTEPTIWRTVEVPLAASLKLLHEVIQAAMPFQNYHLFQFQEGAVRYVIPDPEWHDGNTRSAKSTKLGALVDRGTTAFAYTYDFGDNWQHTITVEEVGPAHPAIAYPRFLDGARRAPPEDVGGTMGFEEFLEAVTKPRHRERKRMLEWYGGPFDPDGLDRETIEAGVSKLARRRAIGQAAFVKGRGRP